MRSLSLLAALVGAAMAIPFNYNAPRAALTSKGFTKADPGGINDIVITADNTLNGTYHDNTTTVVTPRAATSDPVTLKFVNNFSGGSINAYITGLDSTGAIVFIAADGSLVYPSSGGSTTPVEITEDIAIPLTAEGSTLTFTVPIDLSSGRVYFSEGDLHFYMVDTGSGDGLVQPSAVNLQDPSAGVNWGFVEFTYTNGVIYCNISYVDFVGLVLGMELALTDGTTQSAYGLEANSAVNICNGLVTQGDTDGYPWSSMCIADSSGNPLRVLSPGNYYDIDSDAFADYWTDYVDQVWTQYTSSALTINTQTDAGDVACQVSGDTMSCAGDNRDYAKPTQDDIWGCNTGTFAELGTDNAIHTAVVPRLCAAFVRSTLLLDGGNVQPSLPSTDYYTVSPTNHYSRLVHSFEVDGRGYAFSFDDVNPANDQNESGELSGSGVSALTVYVGAPPS